MNRKAILLVVAVFVLGMAVGGLALHLILGRVLGGPGLRGGPNRLVQQLTTDLQLSTEQQRQLGSILEETRARYDKAYESLQPEMQKIREEGRDRIRGILSPAQRAKFDEFVRRIDEERNKRKRGR
jgi:hypothetical protein